MVAFFSKWFTANHLTTLRVALVPIIYTGIVIGRDEHWILFSTWLVFLFACLTDYWDGVLARHQGKTTKLGKLLDPVADKILIGSILVLLVGIDRAPALLTVILISREFIVNGLRSIAAVEGIVISASSGGKLKTISQMFAVGFLIIHYPTIGIPTHEVGIVILWASTVISLWSGYKYVVAYFLAIHEQ
ncbi:MAG: CDP-diacylglycerol--glycerol-3-phosphate 3-phosphatidyltransferase [Deltaproteobacteria bacterium]|jgi:CDP-diacylglycerol--glycerol-3-phosphate 3-phosphatidyltransferase|nr:CDP-diacylglycerol--glycerol-3-phosphate 3-phosphatidyltransferase [SAR324 cluster bacterium]MDP6887957.1 CDP-diacylglycerol--glycerol-3-phosphate 3-phosphatidyltransferase [SAR324 cluster bacterium]PQM54655.1 MAG: CDP-diacylglycerol--glycerol-3-phosphate 3-phosphatidyltransferase [Deltaproteobacteria bacterium]RZO47414.1 MAG: CDP-diacylglycerol--glycerol-3-phosphate 3-phosphatidyltransferase [Pseudomonadota bacterium]HJL94688.1 CDP-diacylglycerol--glycerol-3-phosphate 3-phosphatidyltransfer